ncbi:hypothetical protein [Pedobacter sp. SL55]|uniref:hypothetical protein n=1 Tax=Pedobacter sp. SL55 TaxID=2995161 RepID=UPI00226F7C8E|nr:hypothetical protein [Pedobacter sp. SL55]WAC41071.1 hypothetical protein OVA16_01455 [Pedobacter sp. SL55]
MKITLEEVRELKATLEKLMLYEGHPRLSSYDFRVMQQLNNMECYKSSNEDYDGSDQMGMLRGSIDKCSPEVVEHLKPFVDKHTYVDTVNYKLSFYDNAKVTVGLLGIILLPIAVVYFAVKLIFF